MELIKKYFGDFSDKQLRQLEALGPVYKEWNEKINVISRKVLTDQLREMESDGLVIREEFKELPPRVEYSLTEKGLALLPILYLLEEWEAKYQVKGVHTDKNCAFLNEDVKNKKAVNV